jgi:sodium/potassium-transporting ATPase subunit alpha
MLPDNWIIIHNSAKTTIITTEIVPGDILFFKSRNRIPADIRFIEILSDTKFDYSILTGKNQNLSLDITMTDIA